MGTTVKMTKDMGRGVFATKSYKRKQVIFADPCVVLKGDNHYKLQDSILRFYCFETDKNKQESALALGLGSLINHNGNGNENVTYGYDEKRNVVIFKARRKIYPGDQLFINYGYDPVDKQKRWDLQKVQDERKQVDAASDGQVPSDFAVAADEKEQPLEWKGLSAQLSDYEKSKCSLGDAEAVRPNHGTYKRVGSSVDIFIKFPSLWAKLKAWAKSPVFKLDSRHE